MDRSGGQVFWHCSASEALPRLINNYHPDGRRANGAAYNGYNDNTSYVIGSCTIGCKKNGANDQTTSFFNGEPKMDVKQQTIHLPGAMINWAAVFSVPSELVISHWYNPASTDLTSMINRSWSSAVKIWRWDNTKDEPSFHHFNFGFGQPLPRHSKTVDLPNDTSLSSIFLMNDGASV